MHALQDGVPPLDKGRAADFVVVNLDKSQPTLVLQSLLSVTYSRFSSVLGATTSLVPSWLSKWLRSAAW